MGTDVETLKAQNYTDERLGELYQQYVGAGNTAGGTTGDTGTSLLDYVEPMSEYEDWYSKFQERQWQQQLGMQAAQNATDVQLANAWAQANASQQWLTSMATKFQELPSQRAQREQELWESARDAILADLEVNPDLNWIKIAQVQAMENPVQYDPASLAAADDQYLETLLEGGEINGTDYVGLKAELAEMQEQVGGAQTYDQLRSNSGNNQWAVDNLSNLPPEAMTPEVEAALKNAKKELKALKDIADDPDSDILKSDPRWAQAVSDAETYVRNLEKYRAELAEMNLRNLPWYSLTQMNYWNDLTPEQQGEAARSMMPQKVDRSRLETPGFMRPYLTGNTINLKNLEKAATPSGQSWMRMSPTERRGLQGYYTQAGQSFEDVTNNMMNMLPQNLSLGRTWANA
jgi:hypothetical protein